MHVLKEKLLTNVLQSYLFFKDKGKTTLAGLLKGQPLGSHHLLGVQRHDIELPPKGTLLKLFKVAYILGSRLEINIVYFLFLTNTS